MVLDSLKCESTIDVECGIGWHHIQDRSWEFTSTDCTEVSMWLELSDGSLKITSEIFMTAVKDVLSTNLLELVNLFLSPDNIDDIHIKLGS